MGRSATMSCTVPALKWMGDRTQPPRHRDPTRLDGGAKLGIFWKNCKCKQRCSEVPYNRLLINPVLKADYRTISWHEEFMVPRLSSANRVKKNVDHLRAELPALMLVRDRTHPPRSTDPTVLESGTKLGSFWTQCKWNKKCRRPPYDELLIRCIQVKKPPFLRNPPCLSKICNTGGFLKYYQKPGFIQDFPPEILCFSAQKYSFDNCFLHKNRYAP